MTNNQNFSSDYKTVRTKIVEHLDKSEFDDAYLSIRGILDYPGKIENGDMWVDALTLFKKITSQLEGS